MKEKYEIIELYNEAIASNLHPNIKNPSQYFHYYYRNHDVTHKWVAQYGKWNKEEYCEKMTAEIFGKNFACKGKQNRLPFYHLENKLYSDILHTRKRGLHVSNTFIRIRALQLFQQLKEDGVPAYQNTTFKASNGWRCRFLKRRNLKYCKRKSGKKLNTNSHLPKYL